MTEITHRQVQTNGISMHIAEAGEGPLVVMVHGFPGLWYSWRYQLPALAEAGYHAVAVDQRGYGRTDRPSDPAVYDADYVAGDMLGLLDALGEQKAIFIGHDFGAQLVFNLAVRHPDRVAASKPKKDEFQAEFASSEMRPSAVFAKAAKQHFLHMHYFQTIGPAEQEL